MRAVEPEERVRRKTDVASQIATDKKLYFNKVPTQKVKSHYKIGIDVKEISDLLSRGQVTAFKEFANMVTEFVYPNGQTKFNFLLPEDKEKFKKVVELVQIVDWDMMKAHSKAGKSLKFGFLTSAPTARCERQCKILKAVSQHLLLAGSDKDKDLMIDMGVRYLAGVNAHINSIYADYQTSVLKCSGQKLKPFFSIINPDTGSFCWSCTS
jgi:hypothetical protein